MAKINLKYDIYKVVKPIKIQDAISSYDTLEKNYSKRFVCTENN